jgi:pyrophosphatase PpaX
LEALRVAHDEGFKVGIFTGKTRFTAAFSLEELGVMDRVDALGTEDDCAQPKPHHEGLLKIMTELSIRPERTLYIGDQRHDLQAGRNAGAVTAAALWAEYTTIQPQRDAPDLAFTTAEAWRAFFAPPGKSRDFLA